MSMVQSLRILCRVTFPTGVLRLWEGSGPFVDGNGDKWLCCILKDDALDQIERALNAEAYTLELGLSGISRAISDDSYDDLQAGNVINSKIEILTLECDIEDQPAGDLTVLFTGILDNLVFDDRATEDGQQSVIIVECTNRFALRTQTNGRVLSDVDQRARSAILNPNATPDRFCERTPSLNEKTVRWPAFN